MENELERNKEGNVRIVEVVEPVEISSDFNSKTVWQDVSEYQVEILGSKEGLKIYCKSDEEAYKIYELLKDKSIDIFDTKEGK